ncbi:MAG: hypothetical protein JXR25_16140 [Pontiellaceae bacterium]|nr:hypothetical protein [Pontiellaceae bacterium]MBN2786351.1 hypothetical protein [Pontiellaceae bacterium]
MNTPVLFLIFNRPNVSFQVFERIRDVRPQQLFIAADGPRSNNPDDDRLCAEVRQSILGRIDWPCEVQTLFRNENLGCKLAVSSAITWFFEQVEEGIILEDDCLPDPSFFPFCEELLDRYRNNEKIMMISGDNFQPKPRGRHDSYYFSRYVHIWGWATWRRAWEHYDLSMQKWPAFRDRRKLHDFLPKAIAKRRERQFNRAHSGNISTWDAQWVFACWEAGGLTIQPNHNLVTNIDAIGTHMKIYDPCTHSPTVPVSFPLVHPQKIERHRKADAYTQRNVVLRGSMQSLWLISKYLFRILVKHPLQLPSDIKTIVISLVDEYRERQNNV